MADRRVKNLLPTTYHSLFTISVSHFTFHTTYNPAYVPIKGIGTPAGKQQPATNPARPPAHIPPHSLALHCLPFDIRYLIVRYSKLSTIKITNIEHRISNQELSASAKKQLWRTGELRISDLLLTTYYSPFTIYYSLFPFSSHSRSLFLLILFRNNDKLYRHRLNYHRRAEVFGSLYTAHLPHSRRTGFRTILYHNCAQHRNRPTYFLTASR